MNKDNIDIQLENLLKEGDWITLKELVNALPAADVADFIEKQDIRHEVLIFRMLKKQHAADVFHELNTDVSTNIVNLLTSQQLKSVMDNLAPDQRVALIEELPDSLTRKVLRSLHTDNRDELQVLLGYPLESVGRIMTPKYVSISPQWTVQKSLDYIRTHGDDAETINSIYIVDEANRLIDSIRLRRIILADPTQTILSLMTYSYVALKASEDREAAVKMFNKYNMFSIPVVDNEGIILGIVTVDDVLEVAEEEATEDIHLMAGMNALKNNYSITSIPKMVHKRIGWLCLLAIGQILTASTMGIFENVISNTLILALFVPLIISAGGNSGSQASALIIRALSTDDVKISDWWRVFRKECISGLLIGIIIGGIAFMSISLWGYIRDTSFDEKFVITIIIISMSIISIVLLGNISGAMLPFILRKMGLDPATGSAPLVATFVDIAGILVYFSIAILLFNLFDF